MATAAPLTGDCRVPVEILREGLEYFLEVEVEKEVLEAFGDRQATSQEQRDLILYYAKNDAFPDWLNG